MTSLRRRPPHRPIVIEPGGGDLPAQLTIMTDLGVPRAEVFFVMITRRQEASPEPAMGTSRGKMATGEIFSVAAGTISKPYRLLQR